MAELFLNQMLQPLAAGGIFLLIVMTGVTLVSERYKNAGIVDVVWAFGFIPLGFIFAYYAPDGGLRSVLLLAMITLSSLRLGGHLLKRLKATWPQEDPRYNALRKTWTPGQAPLLFWGLFLLQGLIMLVLSVVWLPPLLNNAPGITPLEWLGILIWSIAWAGEGLADHQLEHWKKKGSGTLCMQGLWRYSRHPNYFFEWLQWCGYFIVALASTGGAWTFYVPALIYFLLTKVTGVKATEEYMRTRYGQDFARYAQTTSSFFPMPPKPQEKD